MPKSNAERQREWRQRRVQRMTEFGAEMDARERALRAERDALRSEAEGLRAALAAAEAEIGRLSRPPCLHPVELVRDGVCECGADVW